MTELMILGAKWHIRQRNIEWIMYETVAGSAIARDIGGIVAEYCLGVERVIQEDVADSIIHGPDEEPDESHCLIIEQSDDLGYVNIRYWCGCHIIPDKYYSICRCTWSNYIEFILTGYNEELFSNILCEVSLVDDMYLWDMSCKQCSELGAQSLSERMLMNLRAEVLKCQ